MTTRAANKTRPVVPSARLGKRNKRGSIWGAAVLFSAVVITGAALGFGSWSQTPSRMPLSTLLSSTHVHGIAVDPKDPQRLYLATHTGFFAVGRDGVATRLSDNQNDYMGFTPHPADPTVFFASGHPSTGGNLGFMTSTDGGKSWRQLATGASGPVDFHQMDVSKADPAVIYGVYSGLQVSRDGGRSWTMTGPAPAGIIDLAASAKDVNTLYAATQTGLLVSHAGGKSWQPSNLGEQPVSMVKTTSAGDVYAFVVGTGLVHATEPSLSWNTLGNSFRGAYVLHLAVDPSSKDRLYAATFDPATHRGDVLATADAGRTWSPLGAR